MSLFFWELEKYFQLEAPTFRLTEFFGDGAARRWAAVRAPGWGWGWGGVVVGTEPVTSRLGGVGLTRSSHMAAASSA